MQCDKGNEFRQLRVSSLGRLYEQWTCKRSMTMIHRCLHMSKEPVFNRTYYCVLNELRHEIFYYFFKIEILFAVTLVTLNIWYWRHFISPNIELNVQYNFLYYWSHKFITFSRFHNHYNCVTAHVILEHFD